MNFKEITARIDNELDSVRPFELQNRLRNSLTGPTESFRQHEWKGKDEYYSVWIAFEIGAGDLVIVYSLGGFAHTGHSWGLSLRNDTHSGPPSNWYRTLEECAKDSGYFE